MVCTFNVRRIEDIKDIVFKRIVLVGIAMCNCYPLIMISNGVRFIHQDLVVVCKSCQRNLVKY